MCGIVGMANTPGRYPVRELQEMASIISHRGPDGAGVWIDERCGVGLAHLRLAIVELSPLGHQPMTSFSQRYVITFNGEIYNFNELRKELEKSGAQFRGSSDTEVMLSAFDRWGVEESLQHFVGMFAFAVWDREEQKLILARDRFGVKPLYYGWISGQGFVFASDLHAIRAHPLWKGDLDRESLNQMARISYVAAPRSVYQGFYKLPPGSLLTIGKEELLYRPAEFSPEIGDHSVTTTAPTPYWSVENAIRQSLEKPFIGSFQEGVDQLEAVLGQAIAQRMVADVPIGAFLSGGIDSSLVVSLMQKLSRTPVKTFCVGFSDPRFDESSYAKEIARHLGTDHEEFFVDARTCLQTVSTLPALCDEPFGDPSLIPTFLVSQFARQKVTVSLSGDGGDELFCGYSRFRVVSRMWKKLSIVPAAVRELLVSTAVRPLVMMLRTANIPLSEKTNYLNAVARKIERVADMSKSKSSDDLYEFCLDLWPPGWNPVVARGKPSLRPHLQSFSFPEMESWFMYFDTKTYLTDDVLVKLDRASMGVALEAREPLLDHRVFEFCWSLPSKFKFSTDAGNKLALRAVLERYVPKHLIDRPKRGFGVPIDTWLRNDLSPWAKDLLSVDRLTRQGIFDPWVVSKAFSEHLSGRRNLEGAIWNVLMIQGWLDHVQTRPKPFRAPAECRVEYAPATQRVGFAS